mgnify:CR=1 FL=1
MIDTDEYIEMWNDHLLGSEGVQDLMNALIAEVERLREQQKKILEIAELNAVIDWSDTDASAEWRAIADILKMCPSCEDKIYFGIEPKEKASE